MLCSLIVEAIVSVETGSAFLPLKPTTHHKKPMVLIHTDYILHSRMHSRCRLAESAATNDETVAADNSSNMDIGSMRISEIKKELVRLNVSSKDCFDRESLVERLLQARQQPQSSQPQQESKSQSEQSKRSESESSTTATTDEGTHTTTAPTAGTSSSSTTAATATTDTKSAQELQEEVSALSVKELRSELAASGKRWAGMLEKRDLVDAVVKCRQESATFSVTGRMRPSKVTDLTADELSQELTSTSTLVLLDVYATWW